jgi:tetratricopeptide (TPR) repeat protein
MFLLNDKALNYVDNGKYIEAVHTYEQAIQLKPNPDDVSTSKARRWVQNNLAWLLATCRQDSIRDGARAITLAQQIVASYPRDVAYLDALAAAYAEVGRFEDAIQTAQKAENNIPKHVPKDDPQFVEYRKHWEVYKSHQPWREPSAIITQNQIDQIENGMTYDQITNLLGNSGEQVGEPKSQLFWSQGGCHLTIILDENKKSGPGSFSWCDEVCEEKDGETWCKSDIPDPYEEKIKLRMSYQEIVEAVGEPNEKKEVLLYKWKGVEGTRKHEIKIYFSDNIAIQVLKFSEEGSKDSESVKFKFNF